jgi:hypothetical protein
VRLYGDRAGGLRFANRALDLPPSGALRLILAQRRAARERMHGKNMRLLGEAPEPPKRNA